MAAGDCARFLKPNRSECHWYSTATGWLNNSTGLRVLLKEEL